MHVLDLCCLLLSAFRFDLDPGDDPLLSKTDRDDFSTVAPIFENDFSRSPSSVFQVGQSIYREITAHDILPLNRQK